MDNELKVLITAQSDQLKAGMQQSAAVVQQSTQQMQTHFSTLNSNVSKQMSAITSSFSNSISSMMAIGPRFGAMIAGALSVGAIKSSIDAFKEAAVEVRSLQRVMGSTAQEAKELSIALDMIGASAESYTSANMKLDMQLKKNEGNLNKLGIATRDSSGHMLSQTEIFKNAIKTMGEYKEGSDRNMFALYAFGRGAAEVQKLMLLNNDTMDQAKQIAAQYGIVVTDQSLAATKKMSIELNVASIGFKEMKEAIGGALMPVLLTFSGTMSDVLPAAITVVVGALKGLITAFELLRMAVKITIDLIAMGFTTVGDLIGSVAYAISRAVRGDFGGAWEAIKEGQRNVRENLRNGWLVMVGDAEEATKRIGAMWLGTETKTGKEAAPGKGSKSFVSPEEKTPKEEKTRTAAWQEELERMKIMEGAYYGFSTDREAAFWEKKLALSKKGSKEWWEIRHAIFELDVKDEKDAAKAAEDAQAKRQNALEAEMQAAELTLQMKEKEIEQKHALGQISDAEEIRALQVVEDTRYRMEIETYNKIAAIYGQETKQFEAMQDKKLIAMGKYSLKVKETENKLQLDTRNTFTKMLQPIQSAISTSIKGMIQGTTTLKNAILNLSQSIVASFIDMVVKMATEWIANQMVMAVTGKAITTASATSQITANAATAASGAASSQAGIPYVGPVLAAAAAAAMLAMVLGFVSMASASGGWDVDQGGLSMIHAKEMVLPAHLAEGVRNMVSGGGSGKSGGDVHLHVHAMDSQDVKSFFKKNGNAVADSLKNPSRNFRFGKG